MAGETPSGPLKVFLWTAPRTVSTSFLKCMTYVPDTVAWHEPYLQIAKFSNRIKDPSLFQRFQEMLKNSGGDAEVAKIESGYDASDKDFDWLKNQLEGEFPGKKMVFVKELSVMGHQILKEPGQDKIPKGFRHTFLIRNPHKMIKSFKKVYLKSQNPRSFNQNFSPDRLRFTQNLNELWKYVKSEGLESRPVVIDVDDLLKNPKDMLEAYCKEVGIPFTEDLLTWPAGDDVMTKLWMVPKQTILTFRTVGAHDGTFASTGFQTKAPSGDNPEDEGLKEVPFIVSEILKGMADSELPYYEELYAERLTVNNN